MSAAWQAGMALVTEARRRFNLALNSDDRAAIRVAAEILHAQEFRQCQIPAEEWPQFGWKTLRAELLTDPLIIAVLEADQARLRCGTVVVQPQLELAA